MTLLFISQCGESLGLSMRCQSEGYSVFFYVEDETASFVGNNIVDKPFFSKHLLSQNNECIASNVNQLLDEVKPDLVIVDGHNLGKVADYIRENNIPVFGSSHWTDTLHLNQEYASEMMKRVGICKWRGEVGVRVECGIFWNGLSSLFPFIVWNEDRLMTGSLGSLVDSASNIISSLSLSSTLLDRGVMNMERLLKKSKFRGILSLSCVVTKDKVYGVSFTSSLLFISSLLELYKGKITDLLLSISSGRKPEGTMTTDYSLSLLLSIPPFPSRQNGFEKNVVKGISPSNLRHLYLLDMWKDGEQYENANSGGKLMMVSARGRDTGEAKKRVMKTVSNLAIENVQYRVDPTSRITIEEGKLKAWNYLI